MTPDLIKSMAGDLEPGLSRRGMCPFCEPKHEPDSFVVRRDNYEPWKLWFQCYRAKCGQRGFVRDDKGIRLYLYAPEGAYGQGGPILDRGEPLPDKLVEELCEELSLTNSGMIMAQGWRYQPHDGALLIPWKIRNTQSREWEQIGWMERHPNGGKFSSKWVPNPPSQAAWTVNPEVDTIAAQHFVIVEDPMSPVRIEQLALEHRKLVRAVSLQGHVLRQGDAMTLGVVSRKRPVTIVLDPDVWPWASVPMLRALRAFGVNARATVLSNDPDKVPKEELHRFLEDL